MMNPKTASVNPNQKHEQKKPAGPQKKMSQNTAGSEEIMVIPLQLTDREMEALGSLDEKIPLMNDYKELLELVSNMGLELGDFARNLVERPLREMYLRALSDQTDDPYNLMAKLNETAEGFSADIAHFHGLEVKDYAKELKRLTYERMCQPGMDRIRGLLTAMEEEVATHNIDLEDNDVLEAVEVLCSLEGLADAAGVKLQIQEAYCVCARYGILRTTAALEKLDPQDKESAEAVYDSMNMARMAIEEIEDEEEKGRLGGNLKHLKANLEDKLEVNKERVAELKGEKQPDNRYIAEYKREIAQLSLQNQQAMNELYQDEENANPTKRYELIVGLFKEALLNEAIGDMERARQLMEDINGEFEDFVDVMKNPQLLLEHYTKFREFANALGLMPASDHTGMMQEKISAHAEATKEERKGFWKRMFGSSTEAPEFFIEKETLDDVMVKYQNRFAQHKVKTQLMVREREIEELTERERIVRSAWAALVLAQSEIKTLQEFGIKEGEGFSQRTLLTDPQFMERMREVDERIEEVEKGFKDGRISKDQTAKYRAELTALLHARHELAGGARRIDESQIGRFEEREGINVVQVALTMTESDVRNDGLIRDTFIQAVTRDIAGRGIIPALDEQVQREGRTGYNVEKAWSTIQQNIPEYAAMERFGISQLVRDVDQLSLGTGFMPMIARFAVDEFFEGFEERKPFQKVGHALAQGANVLKRLKMAVDAKMNGA